MLTATNYKYRNYTTSKVACFISVDPLQFKYSELTPFQYASNRPVSMIDIDGAEGNGFMYNVPSDKRGDVLKGNTDPIKRFTKSFIKGIVGFLVALSEIPGQMEFGNKVKQEDREKTFPYTHNQNFGTLSMDIMISPVIITGNVIKKPSPENLGTLFSAFVLYSLALKGKGYKKNAFTEEASTPILSKDISKINIVVTKSNMFRFKSEMDNMSIIGKLEISTNGECAILKKIYIANPEIGIVNGLTNQNIIGLKAILYHKSEIINWAKEQGYKKFDIEYQRIRPKGSSFESSAKIIRTLYNETKKIEK